MRRLLPNQGPVLYYHSVEPEQPAHLLHYPVLTPRQFEDDLDLVEEVFSVAPAGADAERRGSRALITFDDGLVGVYSVARPILRARGLTAAFFVATDFLDNTKPFDETTISLCLSASLALPSVQLTRFVANAKELLANSTEWDSRAAIRGALRAARGQFPRLSATQREAATVFLGLRDQTKRFLAWACEELEVDPESFVADRRPYVSSEQIREMSNDGFSIGAHSLSHRKLGSLTRDERRKEIVESADRIRQLTNQTKVPFSFPYSGGSIGAEEIAEIRAKDPWIGPFYDSGGLRTAPDRIHRVWAESPYRDTGRRGIEHALARAYALGRFQP